MTGILRVAQESIFSGLNNLTVNTILDAQYDKYFGFTHSEVKSMLAYYGVLSKEQELKDWYDGYLFGDTDIYNSWSVINRFAGGKVELLSKICWNICCRTVYETRTYVRAMRGR